MQKEYMGEVCVEVNGVLVGLFSIPYFVFAYEKTKHGLALLGTLSPSPPLSWCRQEQGRRRHWMRLVPRTIWRRVCREQPTTKQSRTVTRRLDTGGHVQRSLYTAHHYLCSTIL